MVKRYNIVMILHNIMMIVRYVIMIIHYEITIAYYVIICQLFTIPCRHGSRNFQKGGGEKKKMGKVGLWLMKRFQENLCLYTH